MRRRLSRARRDANALWVELRLCEPWDTTRWDVVWTWPHGTAELRGLEVSDVWQDTALMLGCASRRRTLRAAARYAATIEPGCVVRMGDELKFPPPLKRKLRIPICA